MPQKADTRATLVAIVDGENNDLIMALIEQNAQIIALLTEIRDDQRAQQEDDANGNGKNVKVKSVSVDIL